MAFIFILATAFPSGAQPAQQGVEKRVRKLEKRVEGVEKRVTSIEDSRTPEAEQESLKIQPLSVVLVSKKHGLGAGQIGINLILEFKNLTSYDISGFSGTVVFKPEGGDVYTRKMSYSHPIESGGTAQIEMTVSSSETRQYLKFVKAKVIRVVLINQKTF